MKSPSATDFRSYFLTLARYHARATRPGPELDMLIMLQAESRGMTP